MTESGSVAPVVGVIGGGQLARMLAEAAAPLGITIKVLAAANDEGASDIVVDVLSGAPDDRDAIRRLAAIVDVVTIDHENVDWQTLAELESEGVAVWPSVETLRLSDKAHQRRTFAEMGLPVPPFAVVSVGQGSADDRAGALDQSLTFLTEHGNSDGRIVAKASRGGYDGRGVWILDAAELPAFIDDYQGAPLVLEPLLDLELELAVLAARNPSGETRVWPVVETVQVDGMCDEVIMPAQVPEALAQQAIALGREVLERTGSVGVLAVELFVSGGELLINEIAPRVHNSGHVTIEANQTSQFEQHLRAVLDWPLGPTECVAPAAVMHNVVGDTSDPRANQAAGLAIFPGAHVHLYGKTPRPARKLGHVTVMGEDVETCRTTAEAVAAALTAQAKGSR
ncbi:MAG: 5-(carboxyamino)imidazole ribonucleotide synthase [Microthrixaceae bacterium]|nr:5-(carboxyamino)imidazole ribonucleotide synthase [Microthrixaceae bacterium]